MANRFQRRDGVDPAHLTYSDASLAARLAAAPARAIPDTATVREDGKVIINPLRNDDGAKPTIVSAQIVDGTGNLIVRATTLTYEPGDRPSLDEGESEIVTIRYTMRDKDGLQSSSDITVTVEGRNEPNPPEEENLRPIARPDVVVVDASAESATIDVLANDSDDKPGFYLSDFRGPGGMFSIQPSGAVAFTWEETDFRFLGENERKTFSYTYTITDAGGKTATSTARLTIVGSNDAPEARPDRVSTDEDTPLTIRASALLANDVDADTSDTLSIRHVFGAVGGTASLVDDQIVFTPDANFFGTASFWYSVYDSSGQPGARDYGEVTVVVRPVDDPAIALNDVATTRAGASTTVRVLDNDSDPDGNRFAVTAIEGIAVRAGGTRTLDSGAVVKLLANGTVTYDPGTVFQSLSAVSGAANAQASDRFSYAITGGMTASVDVFVNGTYDVTDIALGTSGNDRMIGTALADVFDLTAGARFSESGNPQHGDYAEGGDGSDRFLLGSTWGGATTIVGGSATSDSATAIDEIVLQGNYRALLIEGIPARPAPDGAYMQGVETLTLLSGGGTPLRYAIATADTAIAAGATLTIDASGLGVGETAIFDGSQERDARFAMLGGLGTDSFTGGGGDDRFVFRSGAFGATDKVWGGAGSDTLVLQGDYILTLGGGQLASLEAITLLGAGDPILPVAGEAFAYDVTLAAFPTLSALSVSGAGLSTGEILRVDGGAQRTTALALSGGSGADILIGGALADRIEGGQGADRIRGGGGADVIIYREAAASTGTAMDTLEAFDFASDRIDVAGATADYHRETNAQFSLDSANIDAQLATGLTGKLGARGAILVTATGGTLTGTFLVIDQNGTAGYQAGADLVLALDGAVNIPNDGIAFLI